MEPELEPLISHLRGLEAARHALIYKPTAKGTDTRYSSVLRCKRQIQYAIEKREPSDPTPPASAMQMRNGELIHQEWQALIAATFPNSVAELATQVNEFVSGSCDEFIPEADMIARYSWWSGGHVVAEYKTTSRFEFDKQLGMDSDHYRWNRQGEGPKPSAVIQCALNALGVERELSLTIGTLILCTETFEPLSVSKCKPRPPAWPGMPIDSALRSTAEFHIAFDDTLRLIAANEVARLSTVAIEVRRGVRQPREAVDDRTMSSVTLSPAGGRPSWQCDYCSHRGTCLHDG